MTLILFILILGIIIFSHELGHFLFAKKAGIHIYEFSLGMGPKIFKFNRKNDETDYCIRLFPIGGFVAIAGEDVEVDKKIPKGKSLQDKTWLQRLLVMIAGAMFNFFLALLLLFSISLFQGSTSLKPIIGSVTEGYPFAEVGIKALDEILEVNNKSIYTWDDALVRLNEKGVDKSLNITIKDTSGNITNHDIVPKQVIVISSSNYKDIKEGYFIDKIDGIDVEEDTDLSKITSGAVIRVYDGKEFREYTVDDSMTLEGSIESKYGVGQDTELRHGFFNAIGYAFKRTVSLINSMIITVADLFTGKLSVRNLSGPVGIYSVVGDQASAGFINILSLIALLSVNVGFINLLPFPAFDGGKVLFLIIEKIKGKPVSPKIENTIHNIGFALLMILMVVVTINDLMR